MKKCLYALVVLFVAVMVFAVIRYTSTTADLSGDQIEQTISVLETNNCMACHSIEGKKPFYAIGPMKKPIEKDMRVGFRFVDLENVVSALKEGKDVSEIDLIKIRHSVINGSMPLAKYKMIHWSSNLNKKESQVLADWIRETRNRLYPNPLAAEQFVDEPIRPINEDFFVDANKVALGFDLFHDMRLSANNTVSCAACHGLTTGGVDGLKTSKGIYDQMGGINAPTVYNSSLNFVQFWDGRAADLQAQAGGPPLDVLEMGSNWEQITTKLKDDKEMVKRFKELYGKEGITENTITDAIAEFEKTLITPNSKFDKYLKGDLDALTAEEIEGYEIFKAKDCAACHAGENVGGISFDYMGVANDYFADRGSELHAKDMGRIGVTSLEVDKHKFKTPSLRNIALTGPYFHDGTIETLKAAIVMMAKYQNDVTLSPDESDKILLFLNTLTGENEHMVEKVSE